MIKCIAIFAFIWGLLGLGQSYPLILDGSGDKVWQIPQLDGSFRRMTEKDAIKEASLLHESQELSSKKMDKIRFFLYTADHPMEPIEIIKDDPESIMKSNFNSENPTRFMIHGWNSEHNASAMLSIRDALLLQGSEREFNFFTVDWSVYGHSTLYVPSQKSVSKAGKIVAEFIDWMHDNGNLSFDTLALYGHSLGAHVAGFTGKNVRRGKVQAIIGLDPAMPLFHHDDLNGRLAETDAQYVESIHTNGGMLGFYHPIGTASFYPNGGRDQPGCEGNVGCSHGRSVEYLAEALALSSENGFMSIKCKDFDDIKNESCISKPNDGYVVRLGSPDNARYARGIYYLETNSESPYGLSSDVYFKRL